MRPEGWVSYLREAGGLRVPRLPGRCVVSFRYTGATRHVLEDYSAERLELPWDEEHPIYLFRYRGVPVAFAYVWVGGALGGAMLDTIFTLGAEHVLFFGGVGVLKPEVRRWMLIEPLKQ